MLTTLAILGANGFNPVEIQPLIYLFRFSKEFSGFAIFNSILCFLLQLLRLIKKEWPEQKSPD